ncbi:transcription antitermination factor NusB [Janibacter alkaliphilus]|uniref:16S rRNA (Cytosine967-C5)-methyltransferase n=1 Tax=Janibacter alkaliphilus TaxID=1069963 RepID=A0A852X5H7_9MICO|nr:16S rRNA (cytosine967-C5)-methyltransferase [Janibacter alkaliphilus]
MLRAVDGGAYANLELPQALRRARLSGRDAAFATELTYGTLRMRGLYDPVIAQAADRPVERLHPDVLAVLRLGAHQLLGMRVPEHAAADQSVALTRDVAGQGAAGLVNAVMRRISERSREDWLTAVVPAEPPAERLAVRRSHPVWIVKALRQALVGHGAADAGDIDGVLDELLEAHNTPAPVALAARPGLSTPDELAGTEPGRLSPVAALLGSGDPGDLVAVREGRAAVQDEGSQLLALALAAAEIAPRPDGGPERWLDLCAGPGGKAGLLAALAGQQGATLVANEISEHRADLVRQTLRPLLGDGGAGGGGAGDGGPPGPPVQVRTGDGRLVGQEEPGGYDRVLVDAPCTGLGALRRRPDARWRRSTDDLAQLGPLQRELLGSAIDATRPGGVIGYATCSPHLSETTFVVGDLVRRRGDVEQVDAREALVGVARPGSLAVDSLGQGPAAQLWPHTHGTDGMYLALLRKTEQS